MKRFFAFIIAVLFVAYTSFPVFAAVVHSPSEYSFVSEYDGYYKLNVEIKASKFNSSQLDFWHSFKDAYSGKSSNIASIFLHSSGSLQFLVLTPKTYYFSPSGSNQSVLLNCNDYCSYRGMSIDTSSCLVGGVQTFIGSYGLQVNNGGYSSFWGYNNLVNNAYSTNGAERLSTVNWGGKSLEIVDDLTPHTFTINYQYEDATEASPTYIQQILADVPYSVQSPVIENCQADKLIVSGTMGSTDITETVIYSKSKYTLTINYQYEDGTEALKSFIGDFNTGQSFEIFTPQIEGYVASINDIMGEMGNVDLTYNVIFKAIKKPEPPSSSDGSSDVTPDPPHIDPSSPSADDSIFSSIGDDFLEPEDLVAFDPETIAGSAEMVKNGYGSIVNIAMYGMLFVLGVFTVFEIIHVVAS